MRLFFAPALLFLVACSNGYYEPCGMDGACPGGLLCADPGRNDVCTGVCADASDCAGFGPGSFCSVGGVCLERCDVDEDCPISSYCDTATHACLR